MAASSEIVSTLVPAISLLGLGIVAAVASKVCRLNPIVGYLVVGLALAVFGYAGAFDGPVVAALAEAGVMFLLFNLGLHFSLSKIREEAANIFGFGALQMLIAGGGFTLAAWLAGLEGSAAIIVGAALGLSSTAVVIGVIRERGQQDCPVGRAAQSILIFQDIAAIALLIAAGALAAGSDNMGGELGFAAVKALAAFGVAVLFSRYLTAPMFRIIARTQTSEVFTATALFLALAAGWATGMIGLSLTLGAFLGGVAIADSRYRVLVQTEIEAFRGLFLGFFFMTVGLGIDPAVLAEKWPIVLIVAAVMIVLKCAFNIVAGLVNRWSVPGSVQLGFLLGQGSEFALVVFSLPAIAALVGLEVVAVLIAAIAISMAVTPAISDLGRRIAGKLRSGPADEKLSGDDAPVVIFGMGATGRALADALSARKVGHIAVEADNALFERATADGYDVHFGTPADPRSWSPLSMGAREVIVVTRLDLTTAQDLHPMVEEHLPGLTRLAALDEGQDASAFRDAGMQPVRMSGEGGALRLLNHVLESLGLEPEPDADAAEDARLAA
ncbi:cation:proton antiporter [Pacificimonas sp. WHA3]|uniref:Cation:proton antiporter n=1 Tax=Pacificimonas pallii TaxID=2827236 RepID=A0ABS6SBT7_9SPHN|nr:cation:proton antiporter [Pacificimonas pallii]MBV7255844.1 cation:proton antiporter [Pacificimonas pallii]